MKRIYSFMFAAVAAFAAASCAQEIDNQLPVGETKVYTASVDGTETKAVLDGKSTNWENGDVIILYDGTSIAKYATSLDEPAKQADFTLVENETAHTGNKVIALYPEWADGYKSSVADVDAKKLSKAYLASNQTATAGSYDSNTAIAMAYSEDTFLEFKNATALLKFSVTTENVKAVTVYSLGGEKLTGEWALDYNNGQPKATPAEGNASASWVELSAGDGVFEVGAEYYISVYPQTLASGFAVEFSFEGVSAKQLVKKYVSSVEFKRNVILNIGNYEFTGTIEPDQPAEEWTIAGTFNDWNMAANPMTLENGYYVAKNITGLNFTAQTDQTNTSSATGFQFINKGSWKGGEGKVTAGVWAWVWNDNGSNIYVDGASADTAYDIYLNSTPDASGGIKFVVVAAGSAMPEDKPSEPEVPESAVWGVCATFTNNWDITANVHMTPSTDGWYILENVEMYKDDEFKFVTNDSWDNSLGSIENVLVAESGTEYTIGSDNSKNIKVNKNGVFEISLNPISKIFKVECTEEYTDLKVTITVDNKANWSPLYIYLADGETEITSESGDPVTDNKYEISGDYIGSSLSYKFISGSKQSDPSNVTITKNGATVTLEETIIKLKVTLDTGNSKKWWGDTMKIHVWNTGTSFDTTWPGATMISEGNYTWSINVPSELVGKSINYLVHNGNSWQSSDSKITISASGNVVKGSDIGIN